MSSTSGFADACAQRVSASPNASFGPNWARMPDHSSARNPSSSVNRAREASLPSTARIACSTSSRAVRAVSTVVYTQA